MAGQDTRPARFFVFNMARGRGRVPAPVVALGLDATIRWADRWGSVNLIEERGPLRSPEYTVHWKRGVA